MVEVTGKSESARAHLPGRIEWPTLALIGLTYAAIGGLLSLYPEGSGPAAAIGAGIALVILLAFHTSLVHEIIHGHPTPWRWVNDLLGTPPLTLIFPYPLFRASHLAHHTDDQLTLPGLDPESFFVSRRRWQRMGRVGRTIAWINMTLLGRLILNPLLNLLDMATRCLDDLGHGSIRARGVWIAHILLSATLLVWIDRFSDFSVGHYLVCVYASHSLISLRSFFEHQATDEVMHRIVVVEGCHFLKLLFLNNNFHATHHRYPGLPWYQVERRFRNDGGLVLERNGNFYFGGYREWLRYLLRPVASPIHPFAE